MNKILSLLKFFIGWPLSFIALLFVGKLIFDNSSSLSTNIKNINPIYLGISIICFIAYLFLRSFLWQKILEKEERKISFKDTSYLWAISELKRYAPGNIWSFVSRTALFEERGVEKKKVFYAILVEIILVILGCAGISLLSLHYVSSSVLLNKLIFLLFFISVIFFIFSKKLLGRIKFFPADFKAKDNLEFYLTATSAFFLFGLGTFFACFSVFPLDIYYILGFIGFFVFSLLGGYLSIITPMGLGVREGFMTAALSRFMPISVAAVLAIFSRIVFIISEIIFISFVLSWYKSNNKFLARVEQFTTKNKYEIVLLLGIILYIVYFTTASFLRYDNFYTGRFDLGNMDQTVWNTINGRIFQLTDPNGTNITSRLSFHADFILILLSPLYLIWSNPKMLLLTQTLVLSLGSIFVFLLSKDLLKNKKIAVILSLSYLLNPSLQYTNLYDFHPVALATTLLLCAFYFLYKKKYILFAVFAVLAAITKEQVWIVISLFGLFIASKPTLNFIRGKEKKVFKITVGLTLFVVCNFIFYYLVFIAIPTSRGSEHFALDYYSEFGDTGPGIIKGIFLSPDKIFGLVLQEGRPNYLFQLLAPVGFLALFSPFLIFALPDLGINLLSSNAQLHQIYYQYSGVITPFIFISTIYSIKYLTNRFKKIPLNFYILILIIGSFYSMSNFGPMPGSKTANLDMFRKPLANARRIDSFLQNVPSSFSIASSNNLGSHLSQREKIFTIPIGINEADMIIFLLNDSYAKPSLTAQKQMVKDFENNKNYKEVFKDGEFAAFIKVK